MFGNSLAEEVERHKWRELLCLLEHLFPHLKEINVAQVQFNLTVNIVAPQQPLAESASSGSVTFTQGEANSVVLAAITGGTPPYQAAVDASSPGQLPSGVVASIDSNNNLVLSGTTSDPLESSVAVVLDVTDSTGTSVAKASVGVKGISAPPKPLE